MRGARNRTSSSRNVGEKTDVILFRGKRKDGKMDRRKAIVNNSMEKTEIDDKLIAEFYVDPPDEKEEDEYFKHGVFLLSRNELLCCKFVYNIKKSLDKKRHSNGEEIYREKSYLTDMISISILNRRTETNKEEEKDVVDSLEKYIRSLNLADEDLAEIGGFGSASNLALTFGTHWKETVTLTKK